MDKSVLHLTQEPEFKRRLMNRFEKIAAERERLGLPKAVVIDGVVFRKFPDGRIESVAVEENIAGKKAPNAL